MVLDDEAERCGDVGSTESELNKEELMFQYCGIPHPSLQIQDNDVFASCSA